ncbi:MAG: C69 family dipeptidase [Promethearchaeota archaeon]
MCDTLVAFGNSTKDGSVVFGKNSDRPSNEVQLITYAPRTKHSVKEEVKCTYILIPQVSETAAVLISQPWWMWGAEMGANEHGVVIGNEAVYTYEPLRNIGLLGMDLVRLGLERGRTAREAMEIIIDLLEKFGQGGGCAYDDPSWMYHNSFLIADPEEAYVLEAADVWWITEKVKNVRSISNRITIRGIGDMRRKGIIQYAIEKGYCKDDNDFDFAVSFSGSYIPDRSTPLSRGGKSMLLLNENEGNITPEMMMNFLREHDAGICMHGGFESTGSQVSHLRKEKQSIHWFTGTTLPCLSIYKPYIFPVEGQKYNKPGPYGNIDPEWLWYKHYKSKSSKNIPNIRRLESELISKVERIIHQESNFNEKDVITKLHKINQKAWKEAEDIIQ